MSWLALAVSLAIALIVAAASAMLLRRYLVPRVAGWSARAERSLEVDLPSAEALALSAQALESLAGVELVSLDEESGRVEATLRGDWKTNGSVVTVLAGVGRNRTTELRISSRPAVPQLYDWGVSRRNVDEVAALVARHG